MRQAIIVFLSLLVWAFTASASDESVHASQHHDFRVVALTQGLDHPWGLAFLPDGRMLVTERPGRLRVIGADGRLDPRPIEGIPPVAAVGQGGLLDVALHPTMRKTAGSIFPMPVPVRVVRARKSCAAG